jgi:hypothetical protein
MQEFDIEESIGSLSMLYYSCYTLKKEKDIKETNKAIELIENNIIAQFKKLKKQLNKQLCTQ